MTFSFEEVVLMLHFLKLIRFTVLLYFASFLESEMVDWLKSKSLTRYHGYPRLKTVTKTFLEKVQHKSTNVSTQEVRNSRIMKSSYETELRKMMLHFELLTRQFLSKLFFQVTN